MIVGNPSVFAVESEITKAYERLSFRALGFFVIWIKENCYGIREPTATMLANLFDDAVHRIVRRGSHKVSFGLDATARDIAYAYRRAIYDECEESELFFGMSASDFAAAIRPSGSVWAPDGGDEAFDDGSYVLHFEDENRVRLIAFTSTRDFLYDPDSLREVWLSPSDFYAILQNWRDQFEAEWNAFPKTPFDY